MRTTALPCAEIKLLRRVRAASSRRPPTPSTGRVIAGNDLVKNYASDTLVDVHTGDDDGEEQGALESAVAAGVVARRRGGGGPRGARPGFALGAAEEAPAEEDAESDDEEADEIDPDFDPDDDVTMRDPEPTSRKRKAPPAPRPKRRFAAGRRVLVRTAFEARARDHAPYR